MIATVSGQDDRDALLATVANMRRCEAAGLRVVALDPATGETFSASSGDYFWLGDDWLTSEVDGEPLVLVTVVPRTYKAVTEDALEAATVRPDVYNFRSV